MEPSAHVNVDLELPKRIGRYDAFLQIGAGGMARVYLGVQNGPFDVKKIVVIKQVRQEIASDQQYLEMFIDEASIALRLNHPNVVHTYEVLDEAPDYYLVMEFLDGQSLLEVLRRVGRQKFPLHEHIYILTQLLAGLQYAHELRDFDGKPLNIIHRDVTPSNVFVCRSGTVKLLDFGIAKASGAVAATRNGMLKGKLGYVAPEQCVGHPADPRSDIYAVGVMLWEAMARRRRVSGETQAAQIHARIQGSEPAIERVWPQAPPALAAICRRALSVQPEQRYASTRDFQRDLERYLAQKQSRAGAESVSRLLRPHFERERATLYRAIEAQIGVSAHTNTGSLNSGSGSAPVPVVDATETSPTPVPSVSITPPPSQLLPAAGSNTPNSATPSTPSTSFTPSPSFRALERSRVFAPPNDDDARTSPVPVDDALLRASKPDSAFMLARRHWMAGFGGSSERIAARLRTLLFAFLTMRVRRMVAFAIGASAAALATLWFQVGTRSNDVSPATSHAPVQAESIAAVPLDQDVSKLEEPLGPAPEVKATVDPDMDLTEADLALPTPPPEPALPPPAVVALVPEQVHRAPEPERHAGEPARRASEPEHHTPELDQPAPDPSDKERRAAVVAARREARRARLEAQALARANDAEHEATELTSTSRSEPTANARSSSRSSPAPSSRWARARAARLAFEGRLNGFSLEPGMDLRPPPHAQRSIDEEDPYEP